MNVSATLSICGHLSEIPWMSKLPKHDPLKKRCVAPRLSVRDILNASVFRKDAAWFDAAELSFNAAMPP